jgi:hypothetical protein
VVTVTGGENPTVLIYWGDNDGGTDPYAWDNSVNLGAKGVTVPFYTDITGLTASTNYWYSCFAANSGGSAWAGSSESFTTSALSAPTVTNSTGASSVTATSARLNGVITDTGGENPTVTIYWGDNDGTTNSYAWDNSVNLGVKAGAFYTDITDLTRGAKYYYRGFASNSVGSAWAASSENFTTLSGGVEQKFIGADDATVTGPAGAGYMVIGKFTASASGSVTQFRIKCSGPGNVKVAIYSDSSGEPGNLLNAVNTGTAVTTGWNTISFPATNVVVSTPYWLAFNSDVPVVGYAGLTGTARYKAATYSGFTFPGSAGAGFAPSSANLLLAGWGGGFVSAPPAPPAIVAPKTTVTFEWTASSGATKYRLQVNTVSDFTGTDVFNAEVGTTSQAVTLNVGTTYYWRVKAGNDGGWSGWSSMGNITP